MAGTYFSTTFLEIAVYIEDMATNVSATYILKIMRPQRNLSQCFLRIMMHEKELIQMRVQFYVERNEDITA